MIYYFDYNKKKNFFIELNRKSFIHKYINHTNNNFSFLVLGLGHKTNIQYTTLLKFLNIKKFCLFFVKTNIITKMIQKSKISNSFTALANCIGLGCLYMSLENYTDILKIIENKTTFFILFLIRNKLILNQIRILRILFYKTLFFYGFSHIFYNQIVVKNILFYF